MPNNTYQSEFTGPQMDERFAAVSELQTAVEGLQTAVAAKYSKPAGGIPSTDLDADVNAALAKALTAVQSLADYYTKAEIDAMIAALNSMEYVDVATLPDASASTMGKIYLVGPDGSGYYSYYITSYDGSAYSWVGPLGTTEISLANYATKAELDQKLTKTVLASRNILDPSTIKNGYVKRTDGTFKSNSNYRCSDYIELDGGPLAVNWAIAQSGTSFGPMVLYNAQKERIGSPNPRSNDGPIVLDPARYRDAYEGEAKYVRFTFGSPTLLEEGGALEGQQFAVYRMGYIPEYEAYGTTSADTYVEKKDVTVDDCVFTENEYGKNRCGGIYAATSSILDTSNGYLKSGSGTNYVGVTDYVEVQGNDLVCNASNTNDNASWAAYDKDYKFTHGSAATGEKAGKYKYQAGDVYVRFQLTSTTNVQVEIGDTSTAYVPFSVKKVIKKAALPEGEFTEEDMADIEQKLAQDKIFPNTFKILLPSKVYAVVGDTLQLFFKGIVQAVDPLVRWVKATCTKGKQFRRYWEYTPGSGEAGEYALNIALYDDNLNALSSLGTTLKVVAAPTSPAAMKHVLAIGASTTSGGEWVCEAQRRLLASDGTPQGAGISNVAFVGKESKTKYGQTAGFEAHSGWSWADYATAGRGAKSFRFILDGQPNVAIGNVYSNNGHNYEVTEINEVGTSLTILCDTDAAGNTPQSSGTLTLVSGDGDPTVTFLSYEQQSGNPFWDTVNDKLSFTPYVNTYCGGSIDVVYALLGTNGLYSYSVAQQKAYVQTFVEALHDEYPSCKVVLVGASRPSLVNMMPGYGAGSRFADVFQDVAKLTALYEMYKSLEDDYDYVEFESWAAEFDPDYNFPLTQKAVNTRNNTVTEPYANNTVHPSEAGYMQYADAAYRSVVARLCQSS